MRAGRMQVLAIGASLVMGLAACGDDSDDDETTSGASTQEQKTTTPAPSGKGGLTPPGTKLKTGQTATLGWQPPTFATTSPGKAIKLQVTVESLEKGTKDDLKGINLNADQRGATPYFLKVKLVNLGGTAPGTDDPDLAFDAFDDRRQEQGSVTFIGDFPRCENNRPPKPFSRGKSYESCLTYLVPGGSIEEIRWNDGPAKPNENTVYYDKPVVWTAP
jgi:hypothetical protein